MHIIARYAIFATAFTAYLHGMENNTKSSLLYNLPQELQIHIFKSATLYSQLQLAATCNQLQNIYNDEYVYYSNGITLDLNTPRTLYTKLKNWWNNNHSKTATSWTESFCKKISDGKIRGSMTFTSLTPPQLEQITYTLYDNPYVTQFHIMSGKDIADYHMSALVHALSHAPLQSFTIHHSLVTYLGISAFSRFPILEELDVSDNALPHNLEHGVWTPIDDTTFEWHLKPLISNLKKLSMINCDIQDSHFFYWLPDCIKKSTRLEVLNLAGNYMGTIIPRIAASTKTKQLFQCDLLDEKEFGPIDPPC